MTTPNMPPGDVPFEIIIDRDPDGSTLVTYFFDGQQVTADQLGITEVHVDPSRSGADAEWQHSMCDTAEDLTDAAGAYVRRLTDEYSS